MRHTRSIFRLRIGALDLPSFLFGVLTAIDYAAVSEGWPMFASAAQNVFVHISGSKSRVRTISTFLQQGVTLRALPIYWLKPRPAAVERFLYWHQLRRSTARTRRVPGPRDRRLASLPPMPRPPHCRQTLIKQKSPPGSTTAVSVPCKSDWHFTYRPLVSQLTASIPRFNLTGSGGQTIPIPCKLIMERVICWRIPRLWLIERGAASWQDGGKRSRWR